MSAARIGIIGIGTAVPPVKLSQAEAVELTATFGQVEANRFDKIERIYRGSRIQNRHMAVLSDLQKSNGNGDGNGNGHTREPIQTGDDWNIPFYHRPTDRDDRGPLTGDRIEQYETYAADLAKIAAQQALNHGGVDAKQIDHLVTVSCTGFAAPGVDVSLFERLGLRPNVRRTHVGFMGCHGLFNGLRVADAMVHRYGGKALVCAVELCSVHFAYGNSLDKLIANSLFADGAGAVVLANDPPTNPIWQLQTNASRVLPHTTDLMTWRIGDHGFEMTLSPRLPDVIQSHLHEHVASWLSEHDLSIKDVNAWAIHPGGPRILQAAQESLGLDENDVQASYTVLERFGNMSSPTVLFILEQLRRTDARGPCVALGFGPGLTVEGMLLA